MGYDINWEESANRHYEDGVILLKKKNDLTMQDTILDLPQSVLSSIVWKYLAFI
ncbi:MAG: hypothetical protein H7833_11295 [Magnetococcus sp. DMHC-1]